MCDWRHSEWAQQTGAAPRGRPILVPQSTHQGPWEIQGLEVARTANSVHGIETKQEQSPIRVEVVVPAPRVVMTPHIVVADLVPHGGPNRSGQGSSKLLGGSPARGRADFAR